MAESERYNWMTELVYAIKQKPRFWLGATTLWVRMLLIVYVIYQKSIAT